MNSRVPEALRRLAIGRAGNQCEYCHLSQDGQEASFHIDHVVPVSSGGPTVADNLALACVSCSLRKGARELAVDPETGRTVRIFNPRQQRWQDHFAWQSLRLVGRTPAGRATVDALNLNRAAVLAIRSAEMALGRHPL